MTSVLEIQRASKTYGIGASEVHALTNADLSVDRGELVAVMGPSGCGKSTLLTLAGGLEEATSGTVLINGKSITSMSLNERARMRRQFIGYVFQDFNLLPGLTALENVSLPLELDGQRAKSAQRLAAASLEQLGMAERASHFPETLSGGERQRVAIARAIVGNKTLLLADEPTGALDSMNGEAVLRLLRETCERNDVACVVVTHDAQLASWADRVVFMRDGQIVDGTSAAVGPEELLTPESER